MDKAKNKKNIVPLFIIVIAIALISIGVGLIVTGNNKSFVIRKNKNNDIPVEDPKRSKTSRKELTEEIMYDLLETEKYTNRENENWALGNATILAYNEEGIYLIEFEKIYETNNELVETTIYYEGNKWVIESKEWLKNSRDLSEYNFIYLVENETNLLTNNEENEEMVE